MATPPVPTAQFKADSLVESAGALMFHLSSKRICLQLNKRREVWLFSKGRRDVGEHRADAALREVYEETGYKCHLLPVTLATRATPANQPGNIPDRARTYTDCTEPFMMTFRRLSDNGAKIIWWYIAAIDEDQEVHDRRESPEEAYESGLFGYEEALQTLTFESDREVLRQALDIINTTNNKS